MLQTDRIKLGPIRRDLLETYQRWFNDLDVVRTLAAANLPMSFEAEERWFDGAATNSGEAMFTIYIRTTGQPIGNVGLQDIDHVNGTANYGIVIGEKSAWNQGYGTEATKLMVAYGFDVLGLQNIMLEVYAINAGGIRAYEKAGFQRIGTRRSAVAIGRERTDAVFMDITPEDVPPSNLHKLLVAGPSQD
jgi:diamine N-acetyltransferase